MGFKVEEITLVHRKVGTKHVFTSPQVPELHVSHEDKEVALSYVQPALDVIERMRARAEDRKHIAQVSQERL